jgi:hypothetical protein
VTHGTMRARFPWFPLTERAFVLLCIASIIVIRVGTILVTPRAANFPDLRIYQGTGQTALAGVNPYDFSDHPALREKLRARMAVGADIDGFAQTQDSWNYYVSSNLPASTALYALFETLARGSRFGWRLLFILGDIAIFLGLLAMLKTLHGSVEDAVDQVGMICLAVFNPVLIVAGSAIPEDKQFQTALLLFAATLLLSPTATTRPRGLSIGVVLSLSILFKLFGAFLFPLWLVRARKEGSRFAWWTMLGGLLPLALSFAAFGHYFVATMLARGLKNSIDAPEHASPWMLFPWLVGSEYLIAKIIVVVLFTGVLAVLLTRRRIDLLNFCAGLMVVFACLWLDKGSMNRMNIAIMFAVAALASLSRRLFLYFSAVIVLIGAFGYALGVGVLKYHPEAVDAVFALLFVCAYLAALAVFARVRSAVCSSTTAAEDVSQA